jgi:hypothetical protein
LQRVWICRDCGFAESVDLQTERVYKRGSPYSTSVAFRTDIFIARISDTSVVSRNGSTIAHSTPCLEGRCPFIIIIIIALSPRVDDDVLKYFLDL